jgi:hypothetical protein
MPSMACPVPQHFSTLSHKQQYGKKVTEHEMYALISSTTFG